MGEMYKDGVAPTREDLNFMLGLFRMADDSERAVECVKAMVSNEGGAPNEMTLNMLQGWMRPEIRECYELCKNSLYRPHARETYRKQAQMLPTTTSADVKSSSSSGGVSSNSRSKYSPDESYNRTTSSGATTARQRTTKRWNYKMMKLRKQKREESKKQR
mmetsp:Transcript_41284/g.66423  ORF Transcript_41284/g.66423 Transcript_41284/m.66423 type:complete len:160 (+) Transcript_41284:216-695(+)